jgi:hypothetical protein
MKVKVAVVFVMVLVALAVVGQDFPKPTNEADYIAHDFKFQSGESLP